MNRISPQQPSKTGRGGCVARGLLAWALLSLPAADQTSGLSSSTPARAPGAGVTTGARSTPDSPVKARVQALYGNLPLSFELYQGQADPHVKFLSRGPGYNLFLT